MNLPVPHSSSLIRGPTVVCLVYILTNLFFFFEHLHTPIPTYINVVLICVVSFCYAYLFTLRERERERENANGGRAQTGRQRIPSRLRSVTELSAEPYAWLEPPNCDITT